MSQPVTYTGVVAMAPDRGIGYRGALPWHLPDDLKTFKRITTGHPVLMGRKTYESIGRPLPDRQNIVLTRDPAWTAEGVQVVHSAGELECLELMDPEIMVIGGAEIFSLMMPAMSRMWVSKVKGEYPADTFLPPFENRLERVVLKEHFEDFDLLVQIQVKIFKMFLQDDTLQPVLKWRKKSIRRIFPLYIYSAFLANRPFTHSR